MTFFSWIGRHRIVLVELAAIFLLALLPRMIGIGLFLTADEKNWVGRSYEFLRAMKDLRINDTLQTTHPGVTTMWVAGTAIFLATRILGTPFHFDNMLQFAMAAQIPLALLNALLVVAIFSVLRRLLPRTPAFLAGAAVALDPFLIGYSKIVHVDGLLTGFLVLAGLLLLLADREGAEWAFIGSSVTGALAILSKAPGIFLLPFMLLVLFSRREAWSKPERSERLRRAGQWLLILGIVILILWPALLWVPDPVGNANIVRRDLTTAVVTPHHMEDAYTLNVWHYPAALLTRSTLPAFFGIVVLLVMLVFPRMRSTLEHIVSRRTIFLLFSFVIFFLLMMLLGAKKGDRYILPVFPLLDVIGVIGIVAFLSFVLHTHSRQFIYRVTAVVVLLPLFVTLIRLGPYTLAYFNPLFPHNLSQELGWGEGLDQVAEFLDMQKDDSLVASWYPQELDALTKKHVLHINAHEQSHVGYIVLYRNMFGRAPDHWANDFIDEYYKKRRPVFVAHVNGLEYAWVYKKSAYQAIVGELVPGRFLAAPLSLSTVGLSRIDVHAATYSGKANIGTLTLHLRSVIDGPDLRTVSIPVSELEDRGGTSFVFEPLTEKKGTSLFVVLTSEGTREGNAPTVRVALNEQADWYLFQRVERRDDENADEKRGKLGIEDFYTVGGRVLARDEVLLLQQQ